MDSQICKNCVYFRQHYTISDEHYSELHCGHCTYPRMKHRKPDAKACEHFEQRGEPLSKPNRRDVVHFLNTRMLEYIMGLPLPPEEK